MSDSPGDMRKMMAQLNSEINSSKKNNSKLDKDKDGLNNDTGMNNE